MISQLQGTISYKSARFVILDVHGVGYKVSVGLDTMDKLPTDGSVVRLWTYLAVREDALDLYGFMSEDELAFFELLIGISGIGPKSALTILTTATIPTIKKAVAHSDGLYLSKVSGIGRKTAEKIVLELKNKLHSTEEERAEAMRDEGDALEALKAIGYSEREAREALKKVSDSVTDTGERIKQAIKLLGKK
jgi:holliday junction DNA helicase RuvA